MFSVRNSNTSMLMTMSSYLNQLRNICHSNRFKYSLSVLQRPSSIIINRCLSNESNINDNDRANEDIKLVVESDAMADYLEEEFRTLQILPVKKERMKRKKKHVSEIVGPRYKRMPVNQDWSSVWPAARSFHPSTVPLPLHQGYIEVDKRYYIPRPNKFANPELLKIPNFLHLAPPAIKKHCDAIKKFCTKWPEGLETDEKCDQHFPIEIHTNDFLWQNSSIRDPRARVVALKVKMSMLELDYHAKDKMKRLLNEKYDAKTDMITIIADRCPTKKQNYDLAYYLLTAVYYESWKTEPWEDEKSRDDWERFYWEKSDSKKKIVKYLKEVNPELQEENILEDEKVKNYARAVSDWHDLGESQNNVDNYKKSVLRLLF